MDLAFIESFLLWCSLINISILMVWFLFFITARDFIYKLHGRWFALSDETFDAIHYKAMALWKLAVFMFNLVPYIVVRIIG